jgi:hypothetical protein
MKITVSKTIGKSQMTIEVDERNDFDAFAKAFPFSQKDICGKCGGEDVDYTTTKAKKKDGSGDVMYARRKCLNSQCGATSTLGEYMGGNGYFWKEWEIFNREATVQTPPPSNQY